MIRLYAQLILITIATVCILGIASGGDAAQVNLPAPHNTFTCGRCHGDHPDLGTSGFSNACLTCHRPGVPRGEQKPFSAADAANRFHRLSSAANLRRISHSWEGSATLAAAGAEAPQSPELRASQLAGSLACSACHSVHTAKGTPLLRLTNDRDQLCLDCHRSRFTSDHTHGSHPVNVRYSSADAAPKRNPAAFYLPPRNANPANSSAAPKLTNDTLLCSTCHRVHYADSSSATFDNATSYLHLVVGDGNLLRSDLRGATAASINICSSCHRKPNHDAKGQNIQCADCHGGHVSNDPAAVSSAEQKANVFLVRRYMNISTPAGAVRNKRVFFQQTGLWQRAYKSVDGRGVCQACHLVPTGGGFPAEHELASAPAAICNPCHPHDAASGAFTPAGGSCAACHGYPPTSSGHGGPNSAAAGYPHNEELSAHQTHAGGGTDYRYSCAVCHRGNEHLRGSYQDLYRDTTASSATLFGAAPAYDGISFTCSGVYCHSDGAPRNSALTPVLNTRTTPAWVNGSGTITGCSDCHAAQPATNAHSRHISAGLACVLCHRDTVTSAGTIGNSDRHVNGIKEIAFASSLGTTFWNEGTAGCSVLACHGDGRGGSPNQAPFWNSTLPADCTGCHGGNATSGSPLATGLHASHINQAAIIGVNYRCAVCHGATVSSGSDRTIATPANHLNGAANILFAGGTYSPATRSCAATACHGAGKPTAPQPAAPTWSAASLGCNGCHGTGTNTGAPDYANAGPAQPLANSHPKHVSSPADCGICHRGTTTSGTTIVAGSLSHTNSVIDVNFTSRAGAGAVWNPGAKSCATICHGTSTPIWGSTLPTDCTGCHGGSMQSSAPITTGKHRAHIANYSTLGRGNSYPCQSCHARTVDSPTSISNRNNHGNGFVDYSGMRAGRLASGICSNVACHSTGMQQNQFWNMTAATWGSARTLSCTGCHGGTQLPNGSFAAYTSIAGEPAYPNGGPGTATANSHRAHVPGAGMTNSTGCTACHRTTVDAGIANKFRNYSAQHLDGLRSVSFAASLQGRYSSTTQQCLNLYCHSNAVPFDNSTTVYAAVRWGDTPRTCTSCHDGNGTTSRLSGRHTKHTGGSYAFTCSRCHFGTVNDDGTLKDKTLHANTAKNISFREGGSYNAATKGCSSAYCHSDGRGGAPAVAVTWRDVTPMTCYSCHKGTPDDSSAANCTTMLGNWSTARNNCTPDLTMNSNGHHRLVGPQWVRKYPCYYCHNNTVNPDNSIKSTTTHVNAAKDIAMPTLWAIAGRPAPSYDATSKVCNNVYCHSDGTSDPDKVRPFAWTEPKTHCNSCHGHPTGSCKTCHYAHIDSTGKVWTNMSTWEKGEEWRGAMPMFPNSGAGTARANSHVRHSQTNFTCDNCHAVTVRNGICTDCHQSGIPTGSMGEVAHIDPAYHVNKARDVAFKDGGSYNPISKSCSNTKCHNSGTAPVWGGSVKSAVTCLACHGTSGVDQDDYNAFNGTQARISLAEWVTKGHGRYSTSGSGRYPGSNNPAANFPGNPCWYCHDNNVLHQDPNNPFRLKMHHQYDRRFEKECVYCHMERTDAECLGCHVGQTGTLAPQATPGGIVFKKADGSTETRFAGHGHTVTCTTAGSCHDSDSGTFLSGSHKGHNVNAGTWTAAQKLDVKNQYMMMGVCLQCHDDDSGGQCSSCHVDQANPLKYALGYDPGTGRIKPKQARASAGHFGHKHYQGFLTSGGWTKVYSATRSPILGTYSTFQGVWKGGKFCWDCHDPHGDSNIFMVQKRVATTTDGIFGQPRTYAEVNFSDKATGYSYARKVAPFNGICNVCHSPSSKHFTSNSGDGHNMSRPCTGCHEHRFADSHANKQSCSTAGCHINAKPVPKHTAFGLPRDCTKCHLGTIGTRMDIIGQMKSNSHHVQRASGEIKNTDCYQCHWEASSNGLINLAYHTGYDYRNYSTVANDVVDLVIYGPGTRPDTYRDISTATGRATVARFRANNMGTPLERAAVTTISTHCVSCHSDQNNELLPFDDCKTPRQYAWDGLSITARYSQTGTTSWGKYPGTANAAKKNFTKAFSAHGNAVANQGGWDPTSGLDGDLTGKNQRTGSKNVQCFDCHNSHGSKVVGVTSSYVTYNGTNNGANLKETKKEIGGYAFDYKAAANPTGANPYAAGAGQCFDCHNAATVGTIVLAGKTPWGYFSTYSSSAPVMGYRDSLRFGNEGVKGFITRNNGNGWLDSRKTILGGHMKASEPPGSLANLAKDTGNTTGGSATSLIDSSKSWTSNRWRNLYVLLTSGANSGQLSKITGNTATTLDLEGFPVAVAAGVSYKIVPYSAPVNGLCTPCHDPHGVSPTLGSANQQYAVPLLKGTWMTSPYKEDLPPEDPTTTTKRRKPYGQADPGSGNYNSWGDGAYHQNHPSPSQPTTNLNIDRNTFSGANRISESDNQFAGLCLNCHQQAMLTDNTKRNDGAAGFKTIDRVHETVKGWGVNSEHSFSCSKCHQPHNSGLPRLMQTNCLDSKHRGNRVSGGVPWAADKQTSSSAHSPGLEHRGFPIGNMVGNTQEATTACHVSRFAPTYNPSTPPAQWPAGNNWNNVTPW